MTASRAPSHAASAALQSSSPQLASHCMDAIFAQDSVGVLLTDIAGRLINANHVFCAMLGYSLDALRALRLADVSQAVEWEAEQTQIADAIANGQSSYHMHKRLRHAQGHDVWVGVTVAIVRDETGAPSALFAMVKDLSEQQHAREERQQQLRANEAARAEADANARHLEAIYESLGDGFTVYDTQGRIVRINSAAKRSLGIQDVAVYSARAYRDRIKPLRMRDTHGQSIADAELPIARLLRGETLAGAHSSDVIINVAAGNEVVINVSGGPLRDSEGEIIGAVAVTRDVSAQRQMERAVSQQAREFEAIFASVADGVVVYGPAGEPLRYNPAALAILGWSEVEVDPRTLSRGERDQIYDLQYLDGSPIPVVEQPSMRAMQGKTTDPVIYSLRQPGGRRVILNARAAPLRDTDNQRVYGAVLILRDVTQAQQLDQMKDEFIDIASHELRAPLTPLILASRRIQQLIGKPEHEAKARRFADEVVAHAKRLSRLVEDMLSMTRIEAGRFVIEKETCDLAHTLRAAIEEQSTAWKRPIHQEGLDGALICQADAGRMWQVMTNLLSNAMKYTSADTPVSVSAQISGRGALRKARIVVRDAGPGIAPEALPRLFDRFYRAPIAAEQHRDGLGLGLYITRAIIEGHGGRIRVESREGVGTAFFIDIPVH